jgi:DNA-binding response OmpR family regulator
MAKILCIEDSREFQVYLSSVLREHNITFFGSLVEVLRAIEGARSNFDLILLDATLPDGNGIKILPKIRAALGSTHVPCIVISTDNDTLSKVAAFGVGADDYITKPPDSTELRARVEAKLRWAASMTQENSVINFEDISIDIDRMSVEILSETGSRNPLNLTPLEFKILRLLVSRPGQVFSRDLIIERIWGLGKYITERTIDAHVSHLRTKIESSRVQVETVLSAGYKISKLNNP